MLQRCASPGGASLPCQFNKAFIAPRRSVLKFRSAAAIGAGVDALSDSALHEISGPDSRY